MRVMVTGAGGFLGNELVRALAARGDDVVGFDVNLDKLKDNVPKSVSLSYGDVTDAVSVMSSVNMHRPDAIVHAAALVGALTAFQGPRALVNVNINGSLNIMEAMRAFSVRRLIHISTDDVYGPSNGKLISEEFAIDPSSPYGASKAAVEHFSRHYRSMYGLEIVHLRTAWVYGPGLPRERVPKIFVDAALSGRPLHLETGADTTLDQTHVADFVAGAMLALDCRSHPFEVYNIATGKAPRLDAVVEWIREAVPSADISIGPGNYRYGGQIEMQPRGPLSIARAASTFGYKPKYDLQAGLRAYIEALKA